MFWTHRSMATDKRLFQVALVSFDTLGMFPTSNEPLAVFDTTMSEAPRSHRMINRILISKQPSALSELLFQKFLHLICLECFYDQFSNSTGSRAKANNDCFITSSTATFTLGSATELCIINFDPTSQFTQYLAVLKRLTELGEHLPSDMLANLDLTR